MADDFSQTITELGEVQETVRAQLILDVLELRKKLLGEFDFQLNDFIERTVIKLVRGLSKEKGDDVVGILSKDVAVYSQLVKLKAI